ncbi:hypothetical protein HOLleu_16009 [Holothuria leucospilota]|uniref:Guanylate-binding protein/Atlastin C-terminal domain-containing protein n=1 Tax=Holothuria leucospilota TaxID=206669 RepID=A0A9Q1C611_HOLLE|nr:hypothetical protein HOLleu_16009 [Holothuria leucospilota]
MSNYSNLISSASQGDMNFKECAPNLLWVLRDVLLDPKDSGFENWKDFFYKQVFVKRRERSQSDISFNAVIHAIQNLFSNFDVKAISPPSTESAVCKNLHKPENAIKINKFLKEIHDVRKVVYNAAKIKRVGSTLVSGKDLLSLLETYVSELDKTGDKLSLKTCWVATITLHLQEILQSSCQSLQENISKIPIPLKETEIKERHSEASENAKHYFRDNVQLADKENLNSFLQILEEKISASLVSLKQRNVDASKRFCRAKGDEIISKHFEQISQNALSLNATDQLLLCDNSMDIILREYSQATEGLPNTLEIRAEVEVKINNKIQSTKMFILEHKVCESYNIHMEGINLPVEEDVLVAASSEATRKSLACCCDKVNKFLPHYDSFHVSINEKIDKLFFKFKETNHKMSVSMSV